MPASKPKRFWLVCRRLFRWFRILCWLAVLMLVCSVIYVTQIGVPGFIKTRLVTELYARGVDLEFERMRLHWFRGIVAEKVHLERRDLSAGPRFAAEEITFKLNNEALKKFQLRIDSLLLQQGTLTVPLVVTNRTPEKLQVENVVAELNFLPNDKWELAHFQAAAMGMKIAISGSVANASQIRDWKTSSTATNRVDNLRPGSFWQDRALQINDVIKQLKFSAPPELQLTFAGDAHDPNTFSGDLRFHAAGADTPWGTLQNCSLTIPLNPTPTTNGLFQASVLLDFDNAQTQWAKARRGRLSALVTGPLTNRMPAQVKWELNLRGAQTPYGQVQLQNITVTGRSECPTNDPQRVSTELTLSSQAFQTEWVRAKDCRLTASVVQTLTNPWPDSAQWDLTVNAPKTRWGGARKASLHGQMTAASTNQMAAVTPAWGGWGKLAPLFLDVDLALDEAQVDKPDLRVAKFTLSGQWRGPELEVRKLHADVFDGRVDAQLKLNVATREVQELAYFDFDFHKLSYLLGTNAQPWLKEVQWQETPLLSESARFILPAWTNREPKWEQEVWPTLQMEGALTVGQGSYHGITFNSVKSEFGYSNLTVHLPDFWIKRPEGEARVNFTTDLGTHDFHLSARSGLDPQIARAFIASEDVKTVFNDLNFGTPPKIEAELKGNWLKPEALAAFAHLNLTNVSYQGHAFTNASASATYTNYSLVVTNVLITRGEEIVTAETVHFDLRNALMFVTNGFSTMDPAFATSVIGPETAKAVEPYRFGKPPAVKVNGMIHLLDAEKMNLHFDIVGGPFNYWRFNLMQVTGSVHWVTNTLTITNVDGEFYGGKLTGDAFFDFFTKKGTDYRFHAIATNSNLHTFMTDVRPGTNNLEGAVDCDLNVTHANTDDWDSWQGLGTAKLKDGFLWDIPLFGFLTPVLNTINPGLGKSRVSEGACTYIITNSVIYTKDLLLHSDKMRLKYNGTVDFDARVNARVEAELFRDSNILLRIFGTVLTPFTKIFEYRVTGTLNQPKSEPLFFLPKLLMVPFHPIESFKNLLQPDSKTPPKNPETVPPPAPAPSPQK